MNYRAFLYLFLSIIGTPTLGQTPLFQVKPTKELGNVKFNTMFQDHLGWMWFGGESGLVRYDGLAFQDIILPDSLREDRVTAIYEARGNLWVGFNSGAICILPNNTVFLPAEPQQSRKNDAGESPLHRWIPEEGNPKQPVSGFSIDSSGGFWIATYGEGLYCWKNQRLYQFDTDDGLTGMEIYSITCDGAGRIWSATDAGISICAMPEPGKKQISRLTVNDGLPDEIVYSLLTDKFGDVWVGTYDHGICHYRIGPKKFDFFSPHWAFGPVTGLSAFGSRELWAGTQQNGIIRLETSRLPDSNAFAHPLPESHVLRHGNISALCKDREGLLWVLTNRGAIYSANVRISLLYAPFQNVQSVCVDRNNRLWIGTPSGLYLREGEAFRSVLPGSENVVSLWEAPDGRLWVGTYGSGVYILNPNGNIWRRLTERDGLTNGSILSITGHDNQVWLATLGGVTKIDLNNFKAQSLQSELGAGYVYMVLADSKGRIWFAAAGEGLIVLENGSFRHFQQAAGHPLKTIYSLAEDFEGRIWFSTENDGLYCYDGNQFRRYDTDNHLHSLNISSIGMDGNGYLLVGYEDGIDIITPATGHVAFFDASSNAPTAECSLNAICRDGFGNLWLGTRQGILRVAAFDEQFVYDPEPNIIAVSVFLQPFDFWSDTVFSHDQNYFLFNFTGLWYTNPELVRYRYRLDGFYHDWIVSKEHFASYPNLPPGTYTFRLQASEHGEFEGTPEATYTFRIRPPFWTRWWFILLCALLAAGLLYWVIHARERRFHREATLRRESVESQFAALKSQINPHFLFNSFNTLITIIEENPGVAVEYVEHLSDFYRSILVYREKDLITLGEEMEMVRNFDFLLKKRYENSFRLNGQVNGQNGYVMPLTLQMLVENAVKHNIISSAKPLTVDIFIDQDNYIVVRNNNQRKAKPEPGTHFGLQSLIHRYALLGAPPVVVEDNDVYFQVKVPIL